MATGKYEIQAIGACAQVFVKSRNGEIKGQFKLLKDDKPMAIFYGQDAATNAQKVCDLLNEVSRSQGKY
jgi:hypothetical protein